MKKYLASVLSVFLVSAVSFASPEPISGELTVSHGWVTQPDGTKKSIAGMKLPFTAVPINNVRELDPNPVSKFKRNNDPSTKFARAFLNQNRQRGFNVQPVADTPVYNSNFGVYGYAPSNPSSLDDITLTSTALNKPWTTFSFGFNYDYSSFSPFLIRWRIWKTSVENPAGQNDFTNEIADFGVIWSQSVGQGAFFVTIDISQAGVTTDDLTLFMAQQFREVQFDGEGDFIDGISTVFNGTANAPSIGSSEDQFWYDHDPLDGLYENSEVDYFEGTRADHAWTINVDNEGTVNTLNPNFASVLDGYYANGTYDSLLFAADGDFYSISPFFGGARNSPIAALEIQANCPTDNPISMKFDMLTWSTINNIRASVDFYNYETGQWVTINESVIGSTPQAVTGLYGGAAPVGDFVSNTVPRKVRARVRFINLTQDLPRTFHMNIDRFTWEIVR